MSRSYFFFGLMQLLIAICLHPAWGAVLANPPEVAIAAESLPEGIPPADTVWCDPQIKDTNQESKIVVAQLFDIITGAAKLIYNATDNTKEKEEAAKAAELQRQAEEKAKTDEQNKILKAKELDELKRQNLSNPFDVADNPPAIEKPVSDAGKKQLIDIPQGAAGSSPSPSTSGQNSAAKDVAAAPSQPASGVVAVEQSQVAASAVQVTGNVAAATPSAQAAVVGSPVAVPAAQTISPVEPMAISAGASAVPATHSTALTDQVAHSTGQIPLPNEQVMVPAQVAAPAGQVSTPSLQSAAPTIQAVAVGQIAPQAQMPVIQAPVPATQASILNNSQMVAPVAQSAAPANQVAPPINRVATQASQVTTPLDSGGASGGVVSATVAPVVPTASVIPTPVSNAAGQEVLQKSQTTGQVAVQDSLPDKSVPKGNADTEKTAIQPEKISPPVNSTAVPLKKSDNPFEN